MQENQLVLGKKGRNVYTILKKTLNEQGEWKMFQKWTILFKYNYNKLMLKKGSNVGSVIYEHNWWSEWHAD